MKRLLRRLLPPYGRRTIEVTFNGKFDPETIGFCLNVIREAYPDRDVVAVNISAATDAEHNPEFDETKGDNNE